VSQELSTPGADQTVVAADTHPGLARMIHQLSGICKLREINGDNTDFIAGLMESILSAESIEDIFDAQESGMISGKDFTNRPFLIMDASDIQWTQSTKTGRHGAFVLPFYAVIKVREISNPDVEVTINCGGTTFVSVLFALWDRGYFDAEKAPDGRAFQITATEAASGDGSYLKLVPFKRTAPKPRRDAE
jgi:hypothetical protein